MWGIPEAAGNGGFRCFGIFRTLRRRQGKGSFLECVEIFNRE